MMAGKELSASTQTLRQCEVPKAPKNISSFYLFCSPRLIDFFSDRILNGANLGGELGDQLANFTSLITM